MASSSDPMAALRTTFYTECDELLEAAQDGLLAMQDGRADAETLHAVFRAIHSIKGGAGAFALETVVAFAHQFETVLDEMRAGNLRPDAAAVLLLLQACDGLSDLIAASRHGADPDRDRTDTLLAALRDLSTAKEEEDPALDGFKVTKLSLDLDLEPPVAPAASPSLPVYQIDFTPHDDLYALGNEPLFLFRALADLGNLQVATDPAALPPIDAFLPGKSYLGWTLRLTTDAPEADIVELFEFVDGLCTLRIARTDTPGEGPVAPAMQPLPKAGAAPTADGAAPPEAVGAAVSAPASPDDAPAPQPGSPTDRSTTTTVRVDLDRVDRLVNLVGELVIQQAMLGQSITDSGLTRAAPVLHNLEKLTGLLRDTQDSVMMIRAQPLKSLFQRMSRIVRDASATSGKPARLSLEGETTEIDKTVIEGLADPLTHMLRNAVDHGLEAPDIRAAAGKPAEGVVRLSAAHRAGRVVIEVSDDGGGIDRARVLEIAVARGLVPTDAQLSEAEIDNLLFLPGFSTAGEVSSLSGRGVGMDVVRSAIQARGGRIAIRSDPGRGTTFSVSLPLTLAVLDGIVVEAAGERLVLPVHSIVETLTLTGDEVSPLAAGTTVVRIHGQILTLLDLAAELGYRARQEPVAGAQVLVIALEHDARVALHVDAIQDQRQVVIKGLREGFGRAPGIAAATILGDGQVALILDPVEIAARAGTRTAAPVSFAG